jgi:hypothetical protein
MAELDDLIDGNATDDQSHRPTGTLSGPSARVCAELPTQTGHTIDRLAAGLSSSGAKAKRRAAAWRQRLQRAGISARLRDRDA